MAIMDPTIPYAIVFDIGGCSTEVLWTHIRPYQPPEILDWMSLPFGVVNLVEACGGEVDAFYEQVKTRIINHLSELSEDNAILSLIQQGQVQMIGSSGTTTTIAAMHLDLDYYDRSRVDGLTLSSEVVIQSIQRVRTMKPRERANHPCIGLGRSDLVISGLAILDAICTLWPVKAVRVADRGVRDGILTELIGVQHTGNVPQTLKRIA
jgi:exopolyphosphatase/guanosine-5'-triphosphate,3'-diphosphate pyrophosphatase